MPDQRMWAKRDGLLLRPNVVSRGTPANAQNPPAPAPARETPAQSDPVPEPGARRWRFALTLAWVPALLAGESPIATPMAPLLAVWATHVACARYYKHWPVRYARYGFGVVHAWLIAPVCRLIEWGTDSPPKLALSAGVVTGLLFLSHVVTF